MIDVVRVYPEDEAGNALVVVLSTLDTGQWSWIFDGAEHGDKYTFEFASMSQNDIDELPEWNGF